MTPDDAARVRETVASERGTSEPFDVCMWGSPDQADDFEAAGVTWLVQARGPEDPLDDTRRLIERGPPKG